MECPLLMIAHAVIHAVLQERDTEVGCKCIKQDCAWWVDDFTESYCGIVSRPVVLDSAPIASEAQRGWGLGACARALLPAQWRRSHDT